MLQIGDLPLFLVLQIVDGQLDDLLDGLLSHWEGRHSLGVLPLVEGGGGQDGRVAGDGHVLEDVLLHEHVALYTADVGVRTEKLGQAGLSDLHQLGLGETGLGEVILVPEAISSSCLKFCPY